MTADLAKSWLIRSAPVAAAQAAHRPVVALESTIIAHGMPYPENVRTTREVEASIRDMGAEPATIALIDGRIRIGLSDDELELLGRSGQAHKVSRRDLPAVLASGGLGATTVAGTMICAALAGIEIDTLTQQALAEAKQQGITGKAVTPFLLARIKALTGGRSLATNIALVKHNAEVGARLAVALAQADVRLPHGERPARG